MAEPSAQGHAQKVQGLFAGIAGVYDVLNSVFSLGLDAVWRKRLAEEAFAGPPPAGSRVLDLAAGTLEVSVALARAYSGITVLAMDFCLPMLVKGLPKTADFASDIIMPVVGDARRLPLPDASVHAVTMAFGLRNVRPRSEALSEALRVLTPGGRLCVLEFGSAKDRILFGVYNWYLSRVLPLAGRVISRDKEAYQYLADTVAAYPSLEELTEEMLAVGFASVGRKVYTAGIVTLHTAVKA